jgi:hypothetical protein
MHEILSACAQALSRAWRERSDDGGLSDEVAMIGLMLVAAVIVGGLILAALTGAVSRLDFGF